MLTDLGATDVGHELAQAENGRATFRRVASVGARLPDTGVTYYDVPSDHKVTKYKYTVVNERPVLVDPGTHTIVQVIE